MHSLPHVLHNALVSHKGEALRAVRPKVLLARSGHSRLPTSYRKRKFPNRTASGCPFLACFTEGYASLCGREVSACSTGSMHSETLKQSKAAALCCFEKLHFKAPSAVCLQYFPQPLARLNHVEDSRMIGIRNYLSYLAVDDFTWAGLGECVHTETRKSQTSDPDGLLCTSAWLSH